MPQQPSGDISPNRPASHLTWQVVLAWLAVLIPLLWGVGQTLKKAAVLFR
jgi:hypothetical protein